MAAKAPAKSSTKAAKNVKSSHTTQGKAKYTSAQFKAYQAASKTAIQHAQLTHNASVLQSRRLQGAVKARAKVAAKRQQVITARIKRNAIRSTHRQIVYAHQSRTLRIGAAARLFKAQQVAQNRQFAYQGEAIHSRTTTLQTLTDEQALTTEERYARAARRGLHKKPKTGAKRKGATRKSPYSAIGASAGRSAASRVPASKTRKAAGRMTTNAQTRWITAGNDLDKENCVAVAMANHLLYHTGYRVTDGQVDYLATYHGGNFANALSRLDYSSIWAPDVGLSEYGQIYPDKVQPGMLVGFDVVVGGEEVPHCGLLLEDNRVVSWGEITSLESKIDEAWEIVWTTKSPR